MSFGGGGSTNTTQEFKPPSYTQPGWTNYLNNATTLGSQALTPYGGQTVASLSPMTGTGLQMLSDYATQGSPERWAGGQATVDAATGAAQNPYAGVNPYLSKMIGDSNSAISEAYRTGTASQNDAMKARAGIYGGSEWADQTARNERGLAGQLATNTNNLLGQNYNQSAQLSENDLNRRLTAAGVGQGQQGLDASTIQQMIQGGAIPQQYNQQLFDANRGIYQQNQQAPFTLSDFIGSALSRASGGQGSQTYTGPGQSPLAALGGLGLLGYGAFG